MFGSSRKSATGIHVADGAVHIVELTRSRRETRLACARREELPGQTRLAELGKAEEREGLAAALSAVRAAGDVSFSTTYFALDGQAVFLARRPSVPGDEGATREHLRWEAEQALADDLREYVVDFLTTGRQGFVVAARRAALDLVCEALAAAQIAKPGFDVVPFALCNALELSGALAGEGMEMVVHLANEEATIVAVHDGELEDVEICALGGPPQSGLAAAATGDEGLFDDDLESRGGDVREPGSGFGAGHRIVRESVETMARAHSPDGWPDRLWLAGRVDAGWLEALAGAGARPEVLDALAGMPRVRGEDNAFEPESAAALAVAAGLAFRGLAEG